MKKMDLKMYAKNWVWFILVITLNHRFEPLKYRNIVWTFFDNLPFTKHVASTKSAFIHCLHCIVHLAICAIALNRIRHRHHNKSHMFSSHFEPMKILEKRTKMEHWKSVCFHPFQIADARRKILKNQIYSKKIIIHWKHENAFTEHCFTVTKKKVRCIYLLLVS